MAKKRSTNSHDGIEPMPFGDKEPVAAARSPASSGQMDPKQSIVPEAVSPEEKGESSGKSPPPVEERPYTIGTWRGFTQWRCKFCPWDTLEGEAAILEHLRSAHAPSPEPKSPILIADKHGRQIK